jgi:hypothetical protein
MMILRLSYLQFRWRVLCVKIKLKKGDATGCPSIASDDAFNLASFHCGKVHPLHFVAPCVLSPPHLLDS